MKYKAMVFISLIICMFYCNGCRMKISETDIIGKWVYKINLPVEETGLKDIKEASIEFFGDKTFKTLNIPAVTIGDKPVGGHPALFDAGGKGAVFSGSGIWNIDKGPEGQEGILLHFLEVRGVERKCSFLIHINRVPFGKIISLHYEYDSTLCIYQKVKPPKTD